ncbi:MAG: 2OG-Fe(II) oxygenase [Paracoccaceae bacterium]|nr:2OG-Fe(II) oxygenase [Paracoccaceae bacterium]
MLNLKKFNNEKINTDPFKYIILNNFVQNDLLNSARDDFPIVPGPGSHPPSRLKIEGGFKLLVEELLGDEFRTIIERKFDVNLEDKPTMYTVRGFCRAKDGQIHTDSKSKIITVLLYMNDDDWPSDEGCLRLLNSGKSLEDYFDEVKPKGGTILIFKRSNNSWHGHYSFTGQRRVLQLNWVLNDGVVEREQGRHGFSSRLKEFFNIFKL